MISHINSAHNNFAVKPEKVFLVLALVFGTAISLIIPPFQALDERNHFFRAYQISEGSILPLRQEGLSGHDLPESLKTIALGTAYLDRYPERKYSLDAALKALNIPLNEKERTFFEFPNTVVDKGLYFNTTQKLILLLIVCGDTFLLYTSLYLTFTPVGSRKIVAVYGRFFIPFMPVFSLIATSFFFSFPSRIKGIYTRLLVISAPCWLLFTCYLYC